MTGSCAVRLWVSSLHRVFGLNPRGTHMRFVSTRWSLGAAGLLSALALAACSSEPKTMPVVTPPPPMMMAPPPPMAAPVVRRKYVKRHMTKKRYMKKKRWVRRNRR